MSAFYDQASLVVVPSGYKTSKVYAQKPLTTDGQLSFSRSTGATRVNSAGLIEKVRTNVIPYSQAFDNALWSKDGNGTGVAPSVTANNATAPDGTLTADTIVFNAGAGTTTGDSSVIYQAITLTGLATASFYARVTSGTGQLVFRSVAGSTYTTANLTTTWQRFSAAENGASGFFEIGIRRGLTNEPINASVTVQMWGAQLEAGDVATPYIATTSAAVSVGPVANVPRLDYLGSTCPKLLLEPQRTNLNPYSEQFDNAGWEKTYSTITANATTSPDGYTNADAWFETSDNNWHRLYDNGISVTSGTAYTCSLFVKANGRNWVSIEFFAGGGGFNGSRVWFNIANGTIGTTQTGITAKIENYGNGWYRISATQTAAASATGYILYLLATGDGVVTYAGDPTKGAFVYGGMTEAGAYATSYIPTLGAAVTRGADAASKTGISSLIGQTEGTIYAEVNFDLGSVAQADSRIQLSDGTTSNWIFIGMPDGASSNLIRMYANGPSGSVSAYSSSPVVNGVNKIAFGYKSGSFVLYVNGVQAATSSTTLTMATCSRIDLQGAVPAASTSERENIKQVLLFKTRLTNAQLAELTTL